jgi:ribosomal protein L37AE/L43A
MNEADRDIGKCDACGDDELPRARVKWHGVWAWLCSSCRTTQALLDAS